jgi:hypothetical protein
VRVTLAGRSASPAGPRGTTPRGGDPCWPTCRSSDASRRSACTSWPGMRWDSHRRRPPRPCAPRPPGRTRSRSRLDPLQPRPTSASTQARDPACRLTDLPAERVPRSTRIPEVPAGPGRAPQPWRGRRPLTAAARLPAPRPRLVPPRRDAGLGRQRSRRAAPRLLQPDRTPAPLRPARAGRRSDTVWDLLEADGHLYLRGDGARMTPAGRHARLELHLEKTGGTEAHAEAWLTDTRATGRHAEGVLHSASSTGAPTRRCRRVWMLRPETSDPRPS